MEYMAQMSCPLQQNTTMEGGSGQGQQAVEIPHYKYIRGAESEAGVDWFWIESSAEECKQSEK